MKPTAVYLIQSDNVDGIYKVGLSDFVPRRRAQVVTAYHTGGSIRAEAWFPTRQAAQKAERQWHRFLQPLRSKVFSGREWFALDDDLVNQFIQWSSISPNSLPLRSQMKSGRVSGYHMEKLTNQLLDSIPKGQCQKTT